jgi:predicted nucleic acid-binding protein
MIYYVDATVALYAASRAQRYKAPAVEILRAVASGAMDAVTSAAVIEDIMYRFSGLSRPEEGLDIADQFLRVIPTVFELTASDLARAFTLLRAEPRLPFRVALHGAIMKNHGVAAVITTETAFELLPECSRVDISAWPPEG